MSSVSKRNHYGKQVATVTIHTSLHQQVQITEFLNWPCRFLLCIPKCLTRLPWGQKIIVIAQLIPELFNFESNTGKTICKRGTHICLICQHIITEPITNPELRVRWQRGQPTGCVCESRRREKENIYRSRILQVSKLSPPLHTRTHTHTPDPPGKRSHSGQPETHDVILREHGLPAVSEKVYKP